MTNTSLSAMLERRVGDTFGDVHAVRRTTIPAWVPDCHSFLAGTHHAAAGELQTDSMSGGGFKTTSADARAAAIAECLERLALLQTPPAHTAITFQQALNNPTISTREYETYARNNGFDDTPHNLTGQVCSNVVTSESAWVPDYQLRMVPPPDQRTDTASSSGVALGSRDHAALGAVLELIERDALMVAWYTGRGVSRLEVDPELYESLMAPWPLASGLSVRFYALHSPLGIPVVLCGIEDAVGFPRFVAGCAARTSLDETVAKAYYEAVQGYFAVLALSDQAHATSFGDTSSQIMRVHRFAVLSAPARPAMLEDPAPLDPEQMARWQVPSVDFVARFRDAGMDLVLTDLATADQRRDGIHIVRAWSPDLYQFGYGGRAAAITCHPRLFSHPMADYVGQEGHFFP